MGCVLCRCYMAMFSSMSNSSCRGSRADFLISRRIESWQHELLRVASLRAWEKADFGELAKFHLELANSRLELANSRLNLANAPVLVSCSRLRG